MTGKRKSGQEQGRRRLGTDGGNGVERLNSGGLTSSYGGDKTAAVAGWTFRAVAAAARGLGDFDWTRQIWQLSGDGEIQRGWSEITVETAI